MQTSTSRKADKTRLSHRSRSLSSSPTVSHPDLYKPQLSPPAKRPALRTVSKGRAVTPPQSPLKQPSCTTTHGHKPCAKGASPPRARAVPSQKVNKPPASNAGTASLVTVGACGVTGSDEPARVAGLVACLHVHGVALQPLQLGLGK